MFDKKDTFPEIKITCRGLPGHGSLVAPGSAGEKVQNLVSIRWYVTGRTTGS